MNYFKELIDLYNKLNNKKLSLTEQQDGKKEPSTQAIAKATNYINSAKGKGPKEKLSVTEIPQSFVWEAERGKSKGTVVFDGISGYAAQQVDPVRNNENFLKFARLFDKGEVNSNTIKTSTEVSVDNPNQGLEIPNQSIIERMKLLIPKILDKAREGGWGLSKLGNKQIEGGQIKTYIFGGRPQSLMRQIDNCIIIKKDVNGKFNTGLVKGDTDLKHNVASSFEKILELFIKDELTSENKILLNSLIAITEDERVVIFDGMGSNYGLVFSDGSKFLKNMIGNMESRFFDKVTDGKSIIEQKLSFLNGEVADAVSKKLGVLLEEVMGILCLGNSQTQGSINLREHLMDKYAEKMDETLGVLNPLISNFKDDKQDYATEFSAEMEALREILKGGKEELYKAIIGINSKALRARKPNRSISVGKITRLGRRGDNNEIYNGEDAFIRAARMSGLIIEKGQVKPITIEEAYGDQPENILMRELDVDYKPGQEVWCLQIGYKHYASKWDPSFGSVRSKPIVNFMKGLDLVEGNEKDKAAAQKHRIAMHNIGLDLSSPNTPDAERVSAYHKNHQDNIFTQVNEIKDEKQFDTFKKTLIETLKKTSIYSELYGKLDKKGQQQTKKRLMEILNSIKAPKVVAANNEDRTAEKAAEFEINKRQIAKNAIITFLQNETLNRDIEYKGDDRSSIERKKAAEDYLATKFMLAGGSNDDNLIMDMRLIGRGNHEVFPHNKALAMVRDWREGKGNYRLTKNGNSFRITSGKNDFIEISDEHGKTGTKSSESKVTMGKETYKRLGEPARQLSPKSLTNSKDYPEDIIDIILEYFNSQK